MLTALCSMKFGNIANKVALKWIKSVEIEIFVEFLIPCEFQEILLELTLNNPSFCIDPF